MPPDSDKDRIEELKKSLYERNAPDVRSKRKMRFSDQASDVKTDWEHPKEAVEPSPDPVQPKRSMSLLVKILIASVVFCLIAVGIGAYLFLNGSNLISASNISITIAGPVSLAGGTPASFTIVVANNNSVALQGTDLTVHFPTGTTDPDNTSAALDVHDELLGNIAPGQSVSRTVRAVLFGEENLQKEITADVTYGVQGSSSTFTKEQTYDVLISSSPVSLSASSFKEVISGSPFDITVRVNSNAGSTLKNIVISAVYPFGYSFSKASPQPSTSDNATWKLGDLPQGGSRTIVIHGVLTGEDSDLRAFRFSVGSGTSGNSPAIGTQYATAESDVTIQKPFISLATAINNDSSGADSIGQFGRSKNVSIHWTNNLPDTLSNVIITAHLSGSAYDKAQVTVPGGYFRSSTDDIIWSQQTDQELASVQAGAGGNLTFVVTPADHGNAANPAVNPQIIISTSASADRTSESNVPNSTTPVMHTIKVSSNLSLSGRVLRTIGPFSNTGPIPPVADQKTTYTMVWTVDNTANIIKNAVVTATLPPYVAWLGAVSPSSEDVTYDTNSGTVTWNIGSVGTYTAGTPNRREVYLQVSLEPSVGQIGSAPIMVNQASLTGVDSWTNQTLSSTQGYLTTSFSTDPSYKSGSGTVVAGK